MDDDEANEIKHAAMTKHRLLKLRHARERYLDAGCRGIKTWYDFGNAAVASLPSVGTPRPMSPASPRHCGRSRVTLCSQVGIWCSMSCEIMVRDDAAPPKAELAALIVAIVGSAGRGTGTPPSMEAEAGAEVEAEAAGARARAETVWCHSRPPAASAEKLSGSA